MKFKTTQYYLFLITAVTQLMVSHALPPKYQDDWNIKWIKSDKNKEKKEIDNFFNTKIVEDPKKMKPILLKKENGFIKIDVNDKDGIVSRDGLKLEGLHRKNTKKTPAKKTYIIVNGFFPGLMQTMAPYIKFIDTDHDIIMFNGEGRGNSEGPTRIATYGKRNKLDILGACDYALKQNPNTELYILALCAGAMHTGHMLADLATSKKEEDKKIVTALRKGGVILNGMGLSFHDLSGHAITNQFDARTFTGLLAILALRFIRRAILWPISWLCHWDSTTNLAYRIEDLKTIAKKLPMLLIHDEDDTLAPFNNARWLQKQLDIDHWWIPQGCSKHGFNQYKQSEIFVDVLNKFESSHDIYWTKGIKYTNEYKKIVYTKLASKKKKQ